MVSGAQSVAELIDPDLASDQLSGGGTVERILGHLSVRALTTGQNLVYNFGIITLNDDATDALAVPEPWIDPANWLYEWSDWLIVDSVTDSAQMSRVRVDGRAKRKLPQLTRSVIAVMDNRSLSGTSLAYYFSGKVLVSLP